MATVGIDSVSRLAGSRQIRQVFLRTIATVGQEAGGGLPCPEVSGCYRRSPRFPLNVAIQTALCLPLGVVSTALWTLFGSALRPVLKSERVVRAFNVIMALLLLASLYPVLTD